MKKFVLVPGAVIVAFVVLFISIFNSSAIIYPVSHTSPPQEASEVDTQVVDYPLPYAGRVLPDSPLWSLKALRDKVWFNITPSHTRRAEIALLFADKRLVMSKMLFEKGESEIAISTYTKGEKYLSVAVEEEKIARSLNDDTNAFLVKLAMGSLKHMEVSGNLLKMAPEDAKPVIIQMGKYSQDAYKSAIDALNARQLPFPNNPFDRD